MSSVKRSLGERKTRALQYVSHEGSGNEAIPPSLHPLGNPSSWYPPLDSWLIYVEILKGPHEKHWVPEGQNKSQAPEVPGSQENVKVALGIETDRRVME